MKVLVYPKDQNPYQELLYNNMKNEVEVTFLHPIFNSYLLDIFIFPFQLMYYRILGYKIFHLHWTFAFASPKKGKLFVVLATINYFLSIFIIKLFNFRLVWTVHNVMPHEKQFINDIFARRTLSKLSDAKIILSKSTLNQMEKFKLEIKNVYLIPHGNYINFYENNINKNKARKYFNFTEKDFVFLFFGNISDNKGIRELLVCFEKIVKQKKSTKLIIAGRCSNHDLIKILNEFMNKHKDNVHIKLGYIKREHVQYYYNASNVVVYPVKNVTNSGSIILAFSLSRPIISPRIGSLTTLPNHLSYLYKNNKTSDLLKMMYKSIDNKKQLAVMGINAYKYIKRYEWKQITNETIRVYKIVIK